MKTIVFKAITFASLFFLTAYQSNAQKIQVGTVSNGVATLNMDDAIVTSTFAFILKDATVSNAQIKSAIDSEGLFYYIAANGQRSGQSSVRIAIILTEINGVLAFNIGDGCEMECNAGLPCTACEQSIIVRCKSQNCTCKAGNGGCNSKITFPK